MPLRRNSFHVSEQLHEECEAFVCTLYGKNSSLNCAIACSAQGLTELANFPQVEILCDITRCVPSTIRLPAESPGGQAAKMHYKK